MKTRFYQLLSFLLLSTMIGCTNLPFLPGSGQQATPTKIEAVQSPTNYRTPQSDQSEITPTPIGTEPGTQPAVGNMIRIWLPPEFNPEENSQAKSLLKARLEKFAVENPDIRLETRIKALEGSGGLLESLMAANAAAPLTLPDLVLLPRPLLESAALKGLLYPYDGLNTGMDDQNWYPYAIQSAKIKDSTYGIPFAGDAMVLAYHPSIMDTPPITLEASLLLGEVLLYPAADPQALFTLSGYMAEGGSLQDEQGRPLLDVEILTNVLEYYQQASQAGVMPYWLTQYSDDDQVWETFIGNEYPMAVTWMKIYMNRSRSNPTDLGLALLPTSNGNPFTLATSWCWVLTGQDPVRRSLAVRLAEYLVDKDFLAQWSYSAGYLPPRADSLIGWPDVDQARIMDQISRSARLIPSVDIVSSLGQALEPAVVQVLKAQSEPQAAAQIVVDQINQP